VPATCLSSANEDEAGVGHGFAQYLCFVQRGICGSEEHFAFAELRHLHWVIGKHKTGKLLEELLTPLREFAKSGHVLGQMVREDDGGTGFGEGKEPRECRLRHGLARRNDDDLIARVCEGDAVIHRRCGELAVRDEVESIAALPQLRRNLTDRLAFKPLTLVDVVMRQCPGGFLRGRVVFRRLLPEVMHRPVEQHVVVGLACLQHGLAARDVGGESGHVAPDGIARVELRGGVKHPAGPRDIGGRTGRAVELHAIHSAEKKIVHQRLEVAERFGEVLLHPGARLAAHQRLARRVRGGRGKLHYEQAAVLLVGLRFRNVHRRVVVQHVARRTMRLIPRQTPLLVRPV